MKVEILFVFFISVIDVGFGISSIPDLDDFDELKTRCDKKGGKGTFEKIKTARDDTQTCLEDIIDIDKFNEELEAAKKTGSMDTVFDKYCKKRPLVKRCVKKLYDAFEPCLEDSEKNAINITSYIIQEVGDFACAKEGDRLALFVAEGGVDCIQAHTDGVKNCVNETIKFNPDTLSANTIPKFVGGKKACDDLVTIQNCVVTELEKCHETTPANLIDALFKFVKKLACKNITRRSLYFG